MDKNLLAKFQRLVPTDEEVAEMRQHEILDPEGFAKIVSKIRKQLTAAGVPKKEIEILLFCYGYRKTNPLQTKE